jgi:thiamine biosynthesis lipoprotein
MCQYAVKPMLTQSQSRIALGSTIDLVVVSDAEQAAVDECFRKLWLQIFEFEKRCSRFLPSSELSTFNRGAGLKQPVSEEFRAVLIAASEMATLTNGLYNPFVLPALQRAGYVQSMVAAHSTDTVDDFSERGMALPDQLEISDSWARIPYGTALDLGGCGKGFIGDLLADLADSFTELTGYWFSLGGDVVTGGLDESGKPWVVQIEMTASKSPQSSACVIVPNAERYAVATSSVTRRKGGKGASSWHHIIDPRTGRSAETDLLTASICARTALIADVLASCAIILGSTAKAELADKGALGGVLQARDKAVHKWGKLVHVKPRSTIISTRNTRAGQ